jgi:tight adherence protein C
VGGLITYLLSPQIVASVLTAVAVGAAIITIALPLLDRNDFKSRMKTVATEREQIRQRERARLSASNAKGGGRGSLRPTPKSYMKQLVETFDLKKNASTTDSKAKLARAGYRGQSAEYTFLFFRFVMPIALFFIALLYIFVIIQVEKYPPTIKFGMAIAAALIGFKAPEVFLSNQAAKRATNMKRVFPDSLDLLLICVEAGMSIEQAFRRVSQEIAPQSVALAEELALLTAELSYLPDRKVAYENLVQRTGVEAIKSVATALVQSERYGTPVGTALRTLSQESRDMRMNEAEKKAAALPPKLTVPMILFFLPVLFAVIMSPAIIQVFGWK